MIQWNLLGADRGILAPMTRDIYPLRPLELHQPKSKLIELAVKRQCNKVGIYRGFVMTNKDERTYFFQALLQ